MVIGNGLVAKAFMEYRLDDKYLVFASGVSNSKTELLQEFDREQMLLLEALQNNPEKHLIYFSTCSIDDDAMIDMPYVKHKRSMEFLIEQSSTKYNIFRLSNVAGKSHNPNTVINYFYRHISTLQKFDLWVGAERNIIDIADAYKVMHYIVRNNLFDNRIINVANIENYKVDYIVKCIEDFLGIKAIFDLKDKGSNLHNNVDEILPIFEHLNICFNSHYLTKLLNKYYLD